MNYLQIINSKMFHPASNDDSEQNNWNTLEVIKLRMDARIILNNLPIIIGSAPMMIQG
jgi:hypothetical protein